MIVLAVACAALWSLAAQPASDGLATSGPIFTTKFAGFARTVQLKKDEGDNDPAALSGMLAAIDEGTTNSVYVMSVEGGYRIAGRGGLMGTAMAARGYSGAVTDSPYRGSALHLRAFLI